MGETGLWSKLQNSSLLTSEVLGPDLPWEIVILFGLGLLRLDLPRRQLLLGRVITCVLAVSKCLLPTLGTNAPFAVRLSI